MGDLGSLIRGFRGQTLGFREQIWSFRVSFGGFGVLWRSDQGV